MTWACGCPQTERIDALRLAQNEAIDRQRGNFTERSTRDTFEAVLARSRQEHDELLANHIKTCPREGARGGALEVLVYLTHPEDHAPLVAHLREVALMRGWMLAAEHLSGDCAARDNVESAADATTCSALALAAQAWELCGRKLPPAEGEEEGRSWWYEAAIGALGAAQALREGRQRFIEAHEAARGA